MGTFLIGALLIIVAGVLLSNYLIDRGAQKRGDEQAALPAEAPASPAEAPANEKRRPWLAAGGQPELAQQLRAWAVADLQDAQLRGWISTLSTEQLQAMAEHLATFCSSLGFELSWLIGRRFPHEAQRETARAVVEHYCAACWQATRARGDFQRFEQIVGLLDQPFSREHRPLTQRLYADLVRRRAVPPITPELSVAPEHERHAFVARALKEIAASDWGILEEAYAGAAPAPPTTA